MNGLLTDLLYVAAVAGMFLMLIAPHEGGHFAFAKLFRVRVIEFSIGAGTRLWSTTRSGTLYAIRLLPILGYVRMGGMEANDFNDPSGFHNKPALQRLIILAAGPAANFLVAMILITGFNLTQLNSEPGKVVGVVPGSPAARTGFVPGDHITSVNGKQLTGPGFVRQQEEASPGTPLILAGRHANGQPFTAIVEPVCDSQKHCQIGIGVAPIMTVPSAVAGGVSFPVFAVGGIVQGLGGLITGAIPGGLFGQNGLTGPIGIADVTAGAVSQGPADYIFLVALLSVALGFTNLLPFLALDGGRMAVVLVEALCRRPFDRALELNVQRWGLAALLVLAAIISFLDIQRIASGQFPGVH